MTDNSQLEWYSDPEQLVSLLRGTPLHWGQIPEIMGYDDIVELTRGGQGVVYRARQCSTNRIVAVKVLSEGRFASEASRYRFQREIELAARLRHPHIVRIYDSGITSEGFPFYVMEFVQGNQLVPGQKKPLELFVKICDAVQHAHQHGIIHRDLKPANILIDESGCPHILDFGVAKTSLSDLEITPVSRTGMFLGSLPWASPEQIEKSPDQIDVRTDVYSLGVILYQLVTGRLPYKVSNNLRQMLDLIVNVPPPRPGAFCPNLPDDVETIILTCLAKEPERRYQTVGELAGDIRRYLDGKPIDAKRDHAWYVFRKMVMRHKAVFSLIFLMTVLVLGFAVTMAVLYRRASESELSARQNLAKTKSIQVFLQDMFDLSDPCRSPETSQAVRKMLNKAALSIDDRFQSNPDIEAEVRHMLGKVYWHLSRLDEAEEQERLALSLMEAAHGEMHPDTARILLCLGHIKISRCLFDEAEAMLQRARTILTNEYGDDHVLTARCWLHLAELRRDQFRSQEAETLFRKAYAVYADHPGEDNMYRLKTLIKWANMLLSNQSLTGTPETLNEAEQMLNRALGVMEAYPDENIWAECVIKLHLGRVKLWTEEFDAADTFFQEAIRCGEAVYGPTHNLVADLTLMRGLVLYYQEQFDEAEAKYHRALAINDASGEERYDGRTWCYWHLAHSRWSQRDYENAELFFRSAIAEIMKMPPPERIHLARYLSRLGQLLTAQGKWSEALPLFEEASQLRAAVCGSKHIRTLRSKALFGRCLAELNRFEEGEAILLDTLQVMSESEDAPSAYVEHVLTSLVKLYEAWEKPENAQEFAARLSALDSSN